MSISADTTLMARSACMECRRLKTKCDRLIPCTQCRKRGCENICPTGLRSRGSRNPSAEVEILNRNIESMSARIRELEGALYTAQVQSSSDETPSPPPPRSNYDSSTLSLASITRNNYEQSPDPLKWGQILSRLPSADQGRALIDAYFSNYGWMMSPVSQPYCVNVLFARAYAFVDLQTASTELILQEQCMGLVTELAICRLHKDSFLLALEESPDDPFQHFAGHSVSTILYYTMGQLKRLRVLTTERPGLLPGLKRTWEVVGASLSFLSTFLRCVNVGPTAERAYMEFELGCKMVMDQASGPEHNAKLLRRISDSRQAVLQVAPHLKDGLRQTLAKMKWDGPTGNEPVAGESFDFALGYPLGARDSTVSGVGSSRSTVPFTVNAVGSVYRPELPPMVEGFRNDGNLTLPSVINDPYLANYFSMQDLSSLERESMALMYDSDPGPTPRESFPAEDHSLAPITTVALTGYAMDRQTQGLSGAHMVLSHQRVASIRGSVGSASHQDQNDAPLGSPDIVILKVPKTSVGVSKPAEPDRETRPPFNGIFSSMSETRKKIEKEFNYQQQAEKEVAKLFSFATPAPSTVVSRRHSDEQNGGRKETIVSKNSDTRRSFVALGASKPVASTMKSTLQALGNSSSSFQHVSHNNFSAVHKASFPVDQDPVPVQGTTNQQGSPHNHVQEEMKPVVSPVPNSVPLIPQRMSHEVATEDEERVNNFGMQYTEFSNAPIELRDPEEYHTDRYPSSQNQLSSQEVMDNIPDEPQVEGSLASQEHQRGYEDFVKNLSTYERTHSGQKTECITRWQTSSLEDWKEGKREITEKLNQILEATRAYMKWVAIILVIEAALHILDVNPRYMPN
ncbi:hypothetical protein FRC19_005857 [Serendipita sp. 401]|nr:hypothetical protein FRC19_005857 [Serendipita sp. 401]